MDRTTGVMMEEAVLFGPEDSLVGILTRPPAAPATLHPPGVLLLNAGMVYHIGPNRLHVTLARRLAALGFPVLRFDFSGIGDSPTSRSVAHFQQRYVDEARHAMAVLVEREAADRFILIGMCSGADAALALGSADHRVCGAVLLNGGVLSREETAAVAPAAQSRLRLHYYKKQLLNPRSWMRVVSGRSNLKAIGRTALGLVLAGRPGRKRPDRGAAAAAHLRQLQERGVEILAVYSEGSIALHELELSFGKPAAEIQASAHVKLEVFPRCDHVFTPLWAQHRLAELIETWCLDQTRGNARAARGV